MTKISFPYRNIQPLEIPDSHPLEILEPVHAASGMLDNLTLIQASLKSPLESQNLSQLCSASSRVLVVTDDYSRNTPLHLIVPQVMDELHAGGVPDEQIRLLIATGTHRKMTLEEKFARLGKQIVERYKILDHHFDQADALAHLPDTPGGTEVWVNRAVLEADLVIGIGHIVPHRVAGYSGGGKIIQPGICGAITTGQTHWISAAYEGIDIMGKAENPVRREIESVATSAGLRFLVNVVLDAQGNVVSCFSGNPESVFKAGVQKSAEVFGVSLKAKADIVIADSHPTNSDLWIAAKGIYSGDLALKKDGILILVTPCPEGVSAEYPALTAIGYRPYAEIKEMVERGELRDLALAAHLVHVGRVIREKGRGILVSPGIDKATTEKLGFIWAATPQDAFSLAANEKGKNASVVVLRNGGEIMPISEGAYGSPV